MMWYSYHRDKKGFDIRRRTNGEWYRDYVNLNDHPELETFMDFKTFQSLHDADPGNWYVYTESGSGEESWTPNYLGSDDKYHFIKFINAREYRKFKRWRRKKLKEKDTYDNLQEQLALSKMIRQRATFEAEKRAKELRDAQEDCNRLLRQTSYLSSGHPAWVTAVQNTEKQLAQAQGGKKKKHG